MLNDDSDRSELLERVGRLNQLVKHVQDVLFWWNCPDSEHCRGNSEWKNAIWSDTETIVQRSIELSDYNSQTLLKLRASCFSILNCLFAGHPGMVSMIEVDEATRIVLEISAKVRQLENETPLSGKPKHSLGSVVPNDSATLSTSETTSETGPIEPFSNEASLSAPQRRLLNVMMQHKQRMTFDELRKAWEKDVQEDAIIKALKRLRKKLPRSQWYFEISEANWEVVWHKKGHTVP